MNGDERLIFHANVFRTSHVRWHWEAFPWLVGWWCNFHAKCMFIPNPSPCSDYTRATGSYGIILVCGLKFQDLILRDCFFQKATTMLVLDFCSCHVLTFHTAQGTCRSTAGRHAEGARLGIAGGFHGDTAIPYSWRFYFHGKSYVSMDDLGVPRFRKPPVRWDGQRIFGFDGVTCTVCTLMTPLFGIPIYLLDD